MWSLCGTVAAFGAVDFSKEVFPIFQEHCFKCHGEKSQKGGVGLATYYHSRQLGDSGEALLAPGTPEKSGLIHRIEAEDPNERMPKDSAALSEDKIDVLRRWVAEGAQWPDDGWRPKRHWAYEFPSKPVVPSKSGKGWARNEIDHFIARKLEGLGLGNNPELEKASLLRRLSLDLIGLPPSVEEVDAFLADDSPQAYELQVDRLLASPHFGEKWARQWLDLARYADSEGYQRDEMREIWPYRDWVIGAINRDLPFDQFTIEQIAGDLLPEPSADQLIATGFNRNPTVNLEAGTDPKEDFYKQVVDRVNTTSTVWLGTTMACAQCHNHKYDPFSIKEYYQLFAFFNATPIETKQSGMQMGMSGMVYIGEDLTVPRSEREKKERALATEQLTNAMVELRAHVDPFCDEIVADPERMKSMSATVQKQLKLKSGKRKLAGYGVVINAALKKDKRAKSLLGEANRIQKKVTDLADYRTRVMKDMAKPRETFIAKRGDFLSKGTQVSPGVPAILHAFPEGAPSNRLGLAKWLVSPENPLVGRVTVNRIWAEIFGSGLVPTMEEFGKQGEDPSHPDLLDWLSVSFVETDGWSRKKLIRRIVMSATYRQSVGVRSMAASVDPANQYLWRHPGHRLSAETIRDNALAVSGLLSKKFGGPPAYPFQPKGVWRKSAGAGPTVYPVSKGEDARRRGVYTVWRRSTHYPSFANFDAPDRGACVIQRSRSNTPLQALTLMNDPEFFSMAGAFGRRIRFEGEGKLPDKLRWAFRTVLAREPSEEDLKILDGIYRQEIKAGGTAPDAFVNVATVLLNLHETISR